MTTPCILFGSFNLLSRHEINLFYRLNQNISKEKLLINDLVGEDIGLFFFTYIS